MHTDKPRYKERIYSFYWLKATTAKQGLLMNFDKKPTLLVALLQ
jgi:hypothetical protein